MDKIIKGRLYSTDTAELIDSYENMSDVGNFHYYQEKMYRKKTGEYFLYGVGHALSKYGIARGNERCRSERIVPLTVDEAQEWVADNCSVDTYITLFGRPEE